MRPLDVLRSWAVQDSPPGAATSALVARVDDLPPGWLDAALADRTVVALYNARTATAVVPAAEVAAYATAQLPDDPDPRMVEAVSGALDGAVLSRDELHEELRRRLPEELLPWCPGCQSHHARREVLVTAALAGRLCVAGRAGRQPAFARTDQWVAWDPPPRDEARRELVRRYRRVYGPSKRTHFAQWAGLQPAHARALWELAGDEPAAEPQPLPGLRLIAPGDPILLGRDREALVPDAALRRKVWAPIGGAGIVLDDGVAVALWRGRKRGRRLSIELEPFGEVDHETVRVQAERLAPHRGCTGVELT